MSRTKFAIGCLVQWYEVDIIGEYIETLKKAIEHYDGEVIVDFCLVMNRDLEKTSLSEQKFYDIERNLYKQVKETFDKRCISSVNNIFTIADYRREFNDKFCEQADVLVWGESDMLVPKQAFIVLDNLHQRVPPKYVMTFGICKMWDDSWKPLEHVDFTDKPFIANDYDNWWSLKYMMTEKEMNEINNRHPQPEVTIINPKKFNGCGLVISSEVIKSGVNIPKSVFFVHEDTSFMLMLQKILPDIPQYHIPNILLVHNRNHPKKRMYVAGENGDTLNMKRRSNDWYIKANKFSEENCYNVFNPNHKSKTWEDVWQ